MTKRFFVVFALLLFVLIAPAFAASANVAAVEHTTDTSGTMSAADIQTLCTAPDQASKVACTFYIMGVREGITIAASMTGDKQHLAVLSGTCIPDDLTEPGMELVVKMKLGADLTVFPADRDLPAVSIISAVILKQFPWHK